MKDFLKQELLGKISDPKYYSFDYLDNVNNDVPNNVWLENQTSFIYKVAVMTAIDSNKCDFAHVVIGTQRYKDSEPELKGYLYFCEGENDDMGRVIERAFRLLPLIHSAFDPS